VVTATLRALAPADGALAGKTKPVFAYEASKEERVVARLYGFIGDDQAIRVAAEIYPFTVRESEEPRWFFHDFRTRDHARRFAEETLVALEYLGCIVTDLGPARTAPPLALREGAHSLEGTG
jgi:hypothetical protein